MWISRIWWSTSWQTPNARHWRCCSTPRALRRLLYMLEVLLPRTLKKRVGGSPWLNGADGTPALIHHPLISLVIFSWTSRSWNVQVHFLSGRNKSIRDLLDIWFYTGPSPVGEGRVRNILHIPLPKKYTTSSFKGEDVGSFCCESTLSLVLQLLLSQNIHPVIDIYKLHNPCIFIYNRYMVVCFIEFIGGYSLPGGPLVLQMTKLEKVLAVEQVRSWKPGLVVWCQGNDVLFFSRVYYCWWKKSYTTWDV